MRGPPGGGRGYFINSFLRSLGEPTADDRDSRADLTCEFVFHILSRETADAK
jgi:hypothetical protein